MGRSLGVQTHRDTMFNESVVGRSDEINGMAPNLAPGSLRRRAYRQAIDWDYAGKTMWCTGRDSNSQPSDPKSDALSIELRTQLQSITVNYPTTISCPRRLPSNPLQLNPKTWADQPIRRRRPPTTSAAIRININENTAVDDEFPPVVGKFCNTTVDGEIVADVDGASVVVVVVVVDSVNGAEIAVKKACCAAPTL